MNKITMESSSGTFTISLGYELEAIEDVIYSLVVPCLLAAGFHPDTVKEYINEE